MGPFDQYDTHARGIASPGLLYYAEKDVELTKQLYDSQKLGFWATVFRSFVESFLGLCVGIVGYFVGMVICVLIFPDKEPWAFVGMVFAFSWGIMMVKRYGPF